MRRLTTIVFCVLTLAALSFTGPDLAAAPREHEFREVAGVSKPIYRPRAGEAWKANGRFAGQIKYPPKAFTFSIFRIIGKAPSPGTPLPPGQKDIEDNPFRVEEHKGDISVYESTWMPPGRYRVFITAEGFREYTIQEIEIKKGSDCIMDIDFGTHVFYINY